MIGHGAISSMAISQQNATPTLKLLPLVVKKVNDQVSWFAQHIAEVLTGTPGS